MEIRTPYEQGERAYLQGLYSEANPYWQAAEREAWFKGYWEAKKEDK